MSLRILHAAVSLALAGSVLLLQGCGSGGSTPAPSPAPSPAPDTLLTEYFCGIYYPTGAAAAGLPRCEDVRDAVRSERGVGLPTLTLGNQSKPGLFFVHGWPDSAAEFAAQFAGLCYGPEAKYRCVAATWQNFHPDLPDADESELKFQVTIDQLAATMEAANLIDTTLVIHDWGSLLGYQLMWQYPALMNRTISFDVGVGGSPKDGGGVNETYQDQNILAWRTKDSEPSMGSARYWHAPCVQCAPWRSAWPYDLAISTRDLNLTRGMGPPQTFPLMFMYGNLTRGVPRESDSLFFNETWLEFVRGTPNGRVVVVEGDHWMMHQSPAHVNGEMLTWLENQGVGRHTTASSIEWYA